MVLLRSVGAYREPVPKTFLPAVKMERGGRLGHRQKQSLLCVLPRRERQSVVPSGTPGHTGLRAHGTRRESAFDGGRPMAVYRQRGLFS